MIFAVTLLLVVGYISASRDAYGSNCYNCEYSLKQGYGGYGGPSGYPPCANPDAPGSGVDVWACKSGRCFTRFDEYSKRVTRGCWSGETNVNPYGYGCQKQYDGQVWCFCDASSGGYKPCNNHQCDAYGCRDNSGYGRNPHQQSGGYKPQSYSSSGYGRDQGYKQSSGYGYQDQSRGYGYQAANAYPPKNNGYGYQSSGYGYNPKNAGYGDNSNRYGKPVY